MVEGVLGREGGLVRCRASVPADSPWVRDGRAPAFLAIEIGAQATALLGVEGGPGPRRGFLVGVKDARFLVPTLAAGVPLEVEARDAGSAAPLRTCAIVLRSTEGAVLATATVSVYSADPRA
jgi:predicted hotdog family 3-hydroxylacyl-ACP dehydratase